MNKMLFLNIGWMKNYRGLEDDCIAGGGEFVQQFNDGSEPDNYPPCEIRNFEPHEGYMYGFVRVKKDGSIRIERLGASRKDKSTGNVLVIWVAKSRSNGTVIVGWFRNATVYRDCQLPPEESGRKRPGRQEWGYRVKAKEENCKLLPVEHRIIRVPRGRGGMGQSNVWYADQPENDAFRQEVWEFITQIN
mgnify:CR=1 FL=1